MELMERFSVDKFHIEQHQTLRERLADYLKDSIIKGHLKPGERIAEPELAERFGISRTPVREAFRQLESEGFLTVIPRRGATVSPITDRDVKEFYTIKALLEGYAARIACPKFTEKEIRKMESLNSQMSTFTENDDVKNFLRSDNQLHDVFLEVCGNEKLFSLVHTVVQQFERLRIAALSIPGRMKKSVSQHKDIIEAFKKKKANLVEKLVRANIEQGADVLADEIQKEKTLT
jgi:DNA-binding GntR family transcriptional regulator